MTQKPLSDENWPIINNGHYINNNDNDEDKFQNLNNNNISQNNNNNQNNGISPNVDDGLTSLSWLQNLNMCMTRLGAPTPPTPPASPICSSSSILNNSATINKTILNNHLNEMNKNKLNSNNSASNLNYNQFHQFTNNYQQSYPNSNRIYNHTREKVNHHSHHHHHQQQQNQNSQHQQNHSLHHQHGHKGTNSITITSSSTLPISSSTLSSSSTTASLLNSITAQSLSSTASSSLSSQSSTSSASSSVSQAAISKKAVITQVEDPIDYKTNSVIKPPYSYATLICMAMKANKNKMTLSAIYKWIRENFLYYRNADPSWQVSVNVDFYLFPVKKEIKGGRLVFLYGDDSGREGERDE